MTLMPMASKLGTGWKPSSCAAGGGGGELPRRLRHWTSVFAARQCRIRRFARGSGGELVILTESVDDSQLLDRWPVLASEIRDALLSEGEGTLADHVDALLVTSRCECGDTFCQSFYTERKPDGAYGPGHRSVPLRPPHSWTLILDVVDDRIVHVEVLFREPLN